MPEVSQDTLDSWATSIRNTASQIGGARSKRLSELADLISTAQPLAQTVAPSPAEPVEPATPAVSPSVGGSVTAKPYPPIAKNSPTATEFTT